MSDDKLDLILGRLGDLQQQIAELRDEVAALTLEVQMHLALPPAYDGAVDLGVFGQRPVVLVAVPADRPPSS
jgi:hypothetical protein